jgi:hypothetical protein
VGASLGPEAALGMMGGGLVGSVASSSGTRCPEVERSCMRARAIAAMSQYGGTVLKTSLSEETTKELQDALHGETTAA